MVNLPVLLSPKQKDTLAHRHRQTDTAQTSPRYIAGFKKINKIIHYIIRVAQERKMIESTAHSYGQLKNSWHHSRDWAKINVTNITLKQ